jgi:hypothetical protein
MNRAIPAMLVIATLFLFEQIRTDAVATPASESAFLNMGNGQQSAPDPATGNTNIAIPEEPPTLLLLAIGLAALVGAIKGSKVARNLKNRVSGKSQFAEQR